MMIKDDIKTRRQWLACLGLDMTLAHIFVIDCSNANTLELRVRKAQIKCTLFLAAQQCSNSVHKGVSLFSSFGNLQNLLLKIPIRKTHFQHVNFNVNLKTRLYIVNGTIEVVESNSALVVNMVRNGCT